MPPLGCPQCHYVGTLVPHPMMPDAYRCSHCTTIFGSAALVRAWLEVPEGVR